MNQHDPGKPSAEPICVRDLMSRHLELAVRLLQDGHGTHALDVALGAIRYDAPSGVSPMMQFLVASVLTRFSERTTAGETLRWRLRSSPEVRTEVGRHFSGYERYQQQLKAAGVTAPSARPAQVDRLLAALAAFDPQGASEDTPPVAPPGAVNVVYVGRGGQAQCTRMYVRLGWWQALDAVKVVGHEVPGAALSLQEAATYLKAAGCEPIDALRAEVLLEGVFGPVKGQSFGLALFVGIVSAQLGLPVPADWAFTGAIGRSSAGDTGGSPAPVMPVNELMAKYEAAQRAGMRALLVPGHLVSADAQFEVAHAADGCRFESVFDTSRTVERILPSHRLPADPEVAGWRHTMEALVPALRCKLKGSSPPHFPSHSVFRVVTAVVFALFCLEHWAIGNYLTADFYQGVERLAPALAWPLGLFASLAVGVVTYAVLSTPGPLMARNMIPCWWRSGALLLGGFVLAFLLIQPILRDPFAPPPGGAFLEHRSFQSGKGIGVIYLFAVIYFVSPFYRVSLAEYVRQTGRRVWATDILEGRRWAEASFPLVELKTLITVAAVAIMGLGFLQYGTLKDEARVGHGDFWRTADVIGLSFALVFVVVILLWWVARSAARIKGNVAARRKDRS